MPNQIFNGFVFLFEVFHDKNITRSATSSYSSNMQNVLITGGSGLIGTRLSEILLSKGFSVSHLGRKKVTKIQTRPADSKEKNSSIKMYYWDIEKGMIDEEALLKADYLIHLAGAGIADENWSDARKKEIIKSRTKSIGLITNKLKTIPHKIKSFISASGIGFYGADTGGFQPHG